MKNLAVFAVYAGVATIAWSNVLPVYRIDRPKSQGPSTVIAEAAIQGETVYARMEKTGTQIEARYDIGTNRGKIESVYFPVFAPVGISVAGLLDQCKFYASLCEIPLDDVIPVKAPVGSPKAPVGASIVWFLFMLKDQKEITIDESERVVFKISYWQPHVAGHFYYLPQSIAHVMTGDIYRDWRFPMIVRSLSRITSNPDVKADYDRIGDLLIIYLRNAEIVSIPAP